MHGVKVNGVISQRLISYNITVVALRVCCPGGMMPLLVPGYVAPLRPGTSSLVVRFTGPGVDHERILKCSRSSDPTSSLRSLPRCRRRWTCTRGNSLYPSFFGPSQVATCASGIEDRQVRTKSMLWGHINGPHFI